MPHPDILKAKRFIRETLIKMMEREFPHYLGFDHHARVGVSVVDSQGHPQGYEIDFDISYAPWWIKEETNGDSV